MVLPDASRSDIVVQFNEHEHHVDFEFGRGEGFDEFLDHAKLLTRHGEIIDGCEGVTIREMLNLNRGTLTALYARSYSVKELLNMIGEDDIRYFSHQGIVLDDIARRLELGYYEDMLTTCCGNPGCGSIHALIRGGKCDVLFEVSAGSLVSVEFFALIAEDALKRIAELYEVEKCIRGKPPGERARIRKADAKPKFEALFDWLQAGRGELARAMRYAVTRMKRMKIYLDDGRLELDNNIAERSIRGIAIGKKNYLFAGSDAGGISAAVIYSLVETAKLNNVEPHAWLTHVIQNIADHPMKQINDLLPA